MDNDDPRDWNDSRLDVIGRTVMVLMDWKRPSRLRPRLRARTAAGPPAAADFRRQLRAVDDEAAPLTGERLTS
jgi:hypothetical protein